MKSLYNQISSKILKDFRVKKIDHISFNTLKHPVKLFDAKKQQEEYYMNNFKAVWYKTNQECNRILTTQWNSKLPEDIKYLVEDRYDGANVKEILSYKKYKDIYNYSPYIAWTLVHKNQPSNICLEIEDITICEKLKLCDYSFNEHNHSIYSISKDNLLCQAFLTRSKIPIEFSDGTYYVPYSFISFIQRNREGFDERNIYCSINN